MKAFIVAIALSAVLPCAALAGACEDDLKKIDKALASTEIPADQRTQVEDMRNQAVQLCGAGNEQEGVDVLTEAKAMLSIE
jgi:hypothetical protein